MQYQRGKIIDAHEKMHIYTYIMKIFLFLNHVKIRKKRVNFNLACSRLSYISVPAYMVLEVMDLSPPTLLIMEISVTRFNHLRKRPLNSDLGAKEL